MIPIYPRTFSFAQSWIFALALVFLMSACQKEAPQSASSLDTPVPIPLSRGIVQETPQKAPEFELVTLAGDTLRFSDYRGKTVLVNFWATWCGPCIAEMPELISVHEELGPETFSVIGLSMDIAEKDQIQAFIDEMGVNYPIAVDEGAVAEAFGGVYSLPTTFVVDKSGTIKQRTIGLFPVEAFKPQLMALMNAE